MGFDIRVLAWLGNQLRPESLFEKDLDIDPFVASTPEAIQARFEQSQFQRKAKQTEQFEGNIIQIYLRRLRNISFGFGGSGFFASQSGERPPWYLNPNITFPSMILFVILAFATVFTNGGVREKGVGRNIFESNAKIVSQDQQMQPPAAAAETTPDSSSLDVSFFIPENSRVSAGLFAAAAHAPSAENGELIAL